MAKIKINNAIIGGFVPRDMFVNESLTFCSFSVGVDDSYKDSNGQWVNNTDWINVKFWGKPDRIKRLAQIVKAKTYIIVEGKMKQSSYKDKNGNPVNETYLKANLFHPLGDAAAYDNAFSYVQKNNEPPADGYNYTGGSAAEAYSENDPEIESINTDFLEGIDGMV